MGCGNGASVRAPNDVGAENMGRKHSMLCTPIELK